MHIAKANQVFAPAGQCYNALNFVIDAYKNYQSIFESLNALFEECAEFLGRLPRYVKGKMSLGLSIVSCKVLRHFVDVCDRALKLRSSRLFKVKTVLKVAFLDQNDFSDLLAKMEGLTKKEALEVAADTYVHAAEAADNSRYTRNILEEEKTGRNEEKQQKKDKNILLNTLMFDKSANTWDSNAQAPIATWGSTYQRIRQHHVEGTGNWILQNRSFKAWKNKANDLPVLAVVGSEASGKSYLASTVINYLRTEGPGTDSKTRNLVAFYFLNKKEASASMDSLGKSIIWQFAQSDPSYMQSVALACEKARHIDPKDFLTRLLLDNHKDLKGIDATFYIVINKLGDENDNIHDGVFNFLKNALQPNNRSVRVLFTATPGTVSKLKKNGVACPTISMSENVDDLRLYINSRMDKIDVFAETSDSEDDGIDDLRKMIQSKLISQTSGNFFMMDTIITQISALDYDKDIKRVLDGAGKSLAEHIDDDIRNLNDTRSRKELEEINEVILWISFAQERMTVEKMKVVLQFKNNATSLRPLEERLKKFLLFEIDNEGYVNFRSEKILESIPERAQTAENRQKNDEVVNKGEIDIIRHFLGTVCPPLLVQKLELEQHFQQKLRPRQEQIYQEDRNTAHFRLARTCIFVLANENSDRLRILRGYAAQHLIHHMKEVDLAAIDRDVKAEIGRDLIRMFFNKFAIDNLLWANRPLPYLPHWILDNGAVSVIYRWLKDTAIVKNVNDEEKDWLGTILAGEEHPARTLSEPCAIRMAWYCFRDQSHEALTFAAYEIISLFITEVSIFRIFWVLILTKYYQFPESIPSIAGNASMTTPSADQVESWCQSKLAVEKTDSLWHTQMAIVFHRLLEKSKAEENCREALALDKKNWRASLLLAKIVESDSEAIDTLKKLIRHCEADTTWMKENENYMAEMLYVLGNRLWDDGRFDEAIKRYTRCIDKDPKMYQSALDILSRFHKNQRWDCMIALIEQIRSKSKLKSMVIALATHSEFHLYIRNAVVNTGNFDVLDQIYEDAIQTATKHQKYVVSFTLRQSYARSLSAKVPVPIDDVKNLLEDAARDVPYTNLDLAAAFFLVGYRLGTIYLGNAKAAREAGKEDEAGAWLRQMADIIPEQVTEDRMRLPLRLFAARYYHLYGNQEAARTSAHNTLKIAMELLSDSDSSNDIFAYTKILYAVIPFEDVDNATTALAMMKLEAASGEFNISCSCQCGHTWKAPGDMWWCMDCINLVLTPRCKQDPKVIQSACHKSHSHFYVPQWDEQKMKKFPKGLVPWKDEIITMDKWRGKITKAYNLTK